MPAATAKPVKEGEVESAVCGEDVTNVAAEKYSRLTGAGRTPLVPRRHAPGVGAVDPIHAAPAPAAKLALEHVRTTKQAAEQASTLTTKPVPEQSAVRPKPKTKPSPVNVELSNDTSLTASIVLNLSVYPDASIAVRYFTDRAAVERIATTVKT